MSENTSKIVTDEILKFAIEKALQAVAENLYSFEEYENSEVDAMFDGTSEEIDYYSSLINDSIVSENRLFSSKKISEELSKCILESNAYSDSLLSDLSSISLKYVESLPTIGDSSTIYILKSTDSNPDTLNLYNDGSWTKIGDFSVSLSDYVTTDAMNTALSNKANESEVVKVDNILTSTTGASNSNVLSAGVTVSELAKKMDTDKLVTSLSSASTNDTYPSAKAVYDKIKGIVYSNEDLDLITEPGLYMCVGGDTYGSTHHFPVPDNGYLFHICYPADGYKVQIFIPNGVWGGDLNQYIRRQKGGTWTDWRRMCSTTVADVADTVIDISTLNIPQIPSGKVEFSVKNGNCYVTMYEISVVSTFDTNIKIYHPSIPEPPHFVNWTVIADNTSGNITFVRPNNGSIEIDMTLTKVGMYYGSFSYPVAES